MSRGPARVVVAGAGPAGFYVAIHLIRLFGPAGVRVHVLERLPEPFGLVRFGIAPDHAHTRSVTSRFDKAVREHAGGALRVHLNAGVRTQHGGEGVPASELLRASDAMVLCTGLSAEAGYAEREDSRRLRGVLDAREVVDWYNGHPYANADVGATLRRALDETGARGVAILGVGNVALDVARMLALDAAALARTDVSPDARDVLSSGGAHTRVVHMIGRRSLAQASFTPKEMRELLSLPSARVTSANVDGLTVDDADEAVMRESRVRKRAFEAVRKHIAMQLSAASAGETAQRRCDLRLHFRRTPVGFVEDDARIGHVAGVHLMKTAQSPSAAEVGSADEVIQCDAVVRAFGYRGTPVCGVPWDDAKGVVPTKSGGRVVDASARVMTGLYACGWLRRGASGIIATNLNDAEEVAAAVHDDYVAGTIGAAEDDDARGDDDAIATILREHGIDDDTVYDAR